MRATEQTYCLQSEAGRGASRNSAVEALAGRELPAQFIDHRHEKRIVELRSRNADLVETAEQDRGREHHVVRLEFRERPLEILDGAKQCVAVGYGHKAYSSSRQPALSTAQRREVVGHTPSDSATGRRESAFESISMFTLAQRI